MTESFFDLFEAAHRMAEAAAIERALFHLFGEKSMSTEGPGLAVGLSVASRVHGELAISFEQRLPVSASIPLEQFSGLHTSLGRAAMATISATTAVATSDHSFVAFVTNEVLPTVTAVYDDALEASSPHADGPFRAVLVRALDALRGDQDLLHEVLQLDS